MQWKRFVNVLNWVLLLCLTWIGITSAFSWMSAKNTVLVLIGVALIIIIGVFWGVLIFGLHLRWVRTHKENSSNG